MSVECWKAAEKLKILIIAGKCIGEGILASEMEYYFKTFASVDLHLPIITKLSLTTKLFVWIQH